MADIQKLQRIASQVRRDIIRQTFYATNGHPGASLGCADLLTALYFEVMKHDPSFNMDGKGEDVFYLSNGHISPVFYSVLAIISFTCSAITFVFKSLKSSYGIGWWILIVSILMNLNFFVFSKVGKKKEALS